MSSHDEKAACAAIDTPIPMAPAASRGRRPSRSIRRKAGMQKAKWAPPTIASVGRSNSWCVWPPGPVRSESVMVALSDTSTCGAHGRAPLSRRSLAPCRVPRQMYATCMPDGRTLGGRGCEAVWRAGGAAWCRTEFTPRRHHACVRASCTRRYVRARRRGGRGTSAARTTRRTSRRVAAARGAAPQSRAAVARRPPAARPRPSARGHSARRCPAVP
eukprot:2930200-Prymnesium_polylepis.2